MILKFLFKGGLMKTKYYAIYRTAKSSNKNYKQGRIEKLFVDGEEVSWKNFYLKHDSLVNGYEHIDMIFLSLFEEGGKSALPYPDVLMVGGFYAFNEKFFGFLQENKIGFLAVDTKITNDNYMYFFGFIRDVVNIDLIKSNSYVKSGQAITHEKLYFDSRIVIKRPDKKFSGIGRIDYLPGVLVCTEEIKTKIEKNKFKGLFFEEIETI